MNNTPFFSDLVEAVCKNAVSELMQPVPRWMERMADVSEPQDPCPWDDFKLSKDLV